MKGYTYQQETSRQVGMEAMKNGISGGAAGALGDVAGMGVALGAMLFMPKTQVVGLMVDSDPFEIITTRIMQETAKLLELDFVPTESDVHLVNMCGPGYAIPSPEGNAAIRMMAANEGLFLDPVYTGKAFAGLIKLAREGKFKSDDNVLYLYAGGAGGLFAIDVDLG